MISILFSVWKKLRHHMCFHLPHVRTAQNCPLAQTHSLDPTGNLIQLNSIPLSSVQFNITLFIPKGTSSPIVEMLFDLFLALLQSTVISFLIHIQDDMIVSTKAVHQFSVFSPSLMRPTTAVIWVFLQMMGHRPELGDWSVQSEEWDYSSL